MLNVELFSAKACDCELFNCELKPSAMLNVEPCAVRNVEF